MLTVAKNRKSATLSFAESRWAFKVLTGVKISETFGDKAFADACNFMFAEFGPEAVRESLKGYDRDEYVSGRFDC